MDAATATTIADPPAPTFPAPQQLSPPILAPRPIRPIDATSIIIPATPSRPSTPVAPTHLEETKHEQPNEFEATPAINTKALPVPTSTPAHAHGEEHEREEEPVRNVHVRFDMPMSSPTVLVSRSGHPRPPILLDTAICVLLVSVLALLARRIM